MYILHAPASMRFKDECHHIFITMRRIYLPEFVAEWCRAYDDWYGKFSAKNVDESVYFGTSACEDWFMIWSGPLCVFGDDVLIPGQTLVYGCRNEPKFISMRDFKKNFVFTDHEPFTRKPVSPSSDRAYYQRLQEIKVKIAAA